ncbi:hypothetical protein PTIM40_172 [Cyanophage P-TIM40]|uniref:Uncharacterized protein n=1 Tax=Cyanophage P-TIM40 TaxID=1589733 RepID=A0A0C5AEC2_9CAUD|nr:hypothetical protein AU107_gp172 [Cyanophage P-TIM40]AJK27599.1 hypothetical protein PTIM40_172 [Cyanophage P-TIM40]
MNMYVNLAPPHCKDLSMLTLDVPSDKLDEVLSLLEKNYERKGSKNGKRRGRNR